MERNYSAEVTASIEELTARQRIAVKDFSSATKLNDLITEENPKVRIDVENIVKISVHNEQSKGNNDYDVIVIISKDGEKYRTGSATAYTSAMEIYRELQAANELDGGFVLEFYKVKSNNFDGDFIKCNLV